MFRDEYKRLRQSAAGLEDWINIIQLQRSHQPEKKHAIEKKNCTSFQHYHIFTKKGVTNKQCCGAAASY
jgi:hypothetical protein